MKAAGESSGPKLEVAWVGCRPEVGWFFRLNRGGKPIVEFAQALDADSPSTCKLAGIKQSLLKKGESGEQASPLADLLVTPESIAGP